jgi:aminocarboxymuconate-semialdehyde decarboxylase
LELRPFFSRAAQLGAVIFMHPLAVLGLDRLRHWYLSNLIGNPTDTAVAVASLIFGGVLDELPDLKIVCAHGGGTTACLCGRWDHGWRVRPETRALPKAPSEYLRRLYYDTLTHSGATLNLLLEVIGADRLVLGSDFPYDMGNPNAVDAIETHPRLSANERTQILGENARRLLGLS